MKTINFSHPGGFPLTQQELDFMQSAYTEYANAFAKMGINGALPIIISGMNITYPSAGVVAVSDGWLYYQGNLVSFSGGSVSPTGSDVPMVLINDSYTDLVYNNGVSHPAIRQITATLTVASISTSVMFPVSSLKLFQEMFGKNARESSWGHIGVSTPSTVGGLYGDIYYKKNYLTNTLQIRGVITPNNAQNLMPSPTSINILVGTLSAEYSPANIFYFSSYYYASNLFKDDLGVAWIKQFTSIVNTGGQILINFIRPDAAVAAYTVMFNTIVPLD